MDMIKFILDNQITADMWSEIADEIPMLLGDHAKWIRTLALYVSEGNAGKGDERKAFLGVYNDEVQTKVNWAVKAAEDVWAGKYPSGDARKQAFGADYDLVQYWVNALKPSILAPDNMTVVKDNGGKRYLLKGVPTSRGIITWKGFDQHNQGDNPYRFDGSGCGFMSFYSAIATIKGYNEMPKAYADKYLKGVTGASKCPISIWAGCKLLGREGIKYEWVKGPLTTEGVRADIQNHLEKGMPVIISLSIYDRNGVEFKGRYTNYAHYAIITSASKSGRWYLLDSGGQKPRYVDPADISRFIPGTKKNPVYDPVWNGFDNAAGYVKIQM